MMLLISGNSFRPDAPNLLSIKAVMPPTNPAECPAGWLPSQSVLASLRYSINPSLGGLTAPPPDP